MLWLAKMSMFEAALSSVARIPSDGPRLILGSSSQSRRDLLSATGASYETMSPDIDEAAIGDRLGDPRVLVGLVANAKADALLKRLEKDDERVLVTGDQVVVYEEKIREKPKDLSQLREFVTSYSTTKPCTTVGAICVHCVKTGERHVGIHEASVTFSQIPDDVVDELLEKDSQTLLRCAGGLMVEHELIQPYLVKVEGGVDSIMGLSTHLLRELLDKLSPPA